MTEYNARSNPFPGLRPFESNEEHLFFGRDGQSDELLRRLRRSRFLAVLGTSGSGKSSLVRAGLLPSLYGGIMTQAGSDWRVALFRPGNDPIGNLAEALNAPNVFSAAGEDATLQKTIIEATLRRSALGLVEAVRQTRMPANENLLVVVDQFEEIFRFKRTRKEGSEDEAAAFIKLLIEAKRQSDVPIFIVITMRSDFLGDCAQFRDLPEAINDGQYLIPRMTRDQRREAITGPVAVGGGEISRPLVNRLLNDVGDNPDQLPILQHALMRTWDFWSEHRQNGEPIDLHHYEAVGAMADALSLHADEAYNELPNERSRALAEKLFKSLTEKGPDNREIRRPTQVAEIAAIAEASAVEVIAVIEPFRLPGRSFLMPPQEVALDDETLIDISHESLIRGWERLRNWVNEEARSANIYRRLAETAVLHREGKAGLWHDPDLALALKWRDDNRPNAVWAQHYHPDFDAAMAFLDHSVEARDAAIAEKERARKREVRRTRIFATIFGVLFLISAAFGAFAYDAKKKAVTARDEAIRSEKKALEAERNARIAEDASHRHALAEEVARTEAETARKLEAEQAQKATQQAQIAEAAKESAQKQARIAEEQRKEAQAATERERQAQLVANQRRVEAERAAFRVRRENLSDKSTIESMANRLIALSSPQEAAPWRLDKASALTQLGRHDESMQESSAMLDYFPENLWARINRGYMNLIVDKPNPEEALKDFKRALEIEPHSSLNYLNLGITEAMMKRYDDATGSISNAINWYRPMLDEGAFESAVSEDIKKATHRTVIISDGPATITAYHYELANLAAFKGGKDFEAKLQEADEQANMSGSPIEGYLTALNWAWLQTRYVPADYGALAGQGHLWQKAGYADWARYYYLTFQCKHRELKDPRYGGLATWVARQLDGLPKNVLVSCTTAPNSEPDPRARAFEAEELVKAGKYNDAISLLSTGIKNDPDNIELLLRRAQYFQWNYDYTKSKQDFDKVLKLAETNPGYKPFVYWYWGILGKSTGAIDDKQMETYLRKALELGPAQSEILITLSDLGARNNNSEEAIKLLQQSLRLSVSAETYFKLAQLQNKIGRHKDALESIKFAIALRNDNSEYYEQRESVEEGLGISKVERKRHLADGYAEIGDSQLKHGKTAEAYEVYKKALDMLSQVAKLDKSGAVSADIVILNAKLSRAIEGSFERTSGRILRVKEGDGPTREVTIDRGGDDGVTAGAEGTLWSIYSKFADHERKVLTLGKARVISVEPRSATVEITMDDPKADKLVRVGDMIEVEAKVPPIAERSILWRLAKYHINFTTEDGERVFADYRKLYAGENAELVNEALEEMAKDITKTGEKFADAEFMRAVIKEGRFKDKTLRQVMEKPARADLLDFLRYVMRYPATYYGKDVKLSRSFGDWALGGPE